MVGPAPSSSTLLAASTGKESVAIIGGGIAGLSCAQRLSLSGNFDCTVFDTGRLRPGGRCSSRLVGDKPKAESEGLQVPEVYPILSKHIIDHAAQILTVPAGPEYTEFRKQVKQWEVQGIVRRYPTKTVCDILTNNKQGQGGVFYLKPLNTENGDDKPLMYYGTKGMASIPLAMAQSSGGMFQIHQDVWVSPSNGVRYQRGTSRNWKLQANGQTLGLFDRIVIAHNGKCADRLMSKTPAKDLHSLLQVNFSPSVPKWGGKRMTLNSIYSLTIAIDATTCPLSQVLDKNRFICGFVKNEPSLRFLSCQSRKYISTDPEHPNVEVWTILSSPTFAKQYKAPQEFLPPETVSNVTALLLQAVERSLGLPTDSLSNEILERRLQLWGAAVPLNVWTSRDDRKNHDDESSGFVYDGEYRVGVCGDWLLRPSIAGAWESGRRLAEFMEQSKLSKSEQSVGLPTLGGKFLVSNEASRAGIGALR